MTDTFEAIVTSSEQKPGEGVSSRDDLSEVKGIGASTAEKLYMAKIFTIRQLANISPEKLAEAPGIGIATAKKFITEAQKHLDGFQKQVPLVIPEHSEKTLEIFPVAEEYVEIEDVEESYTPPNIEKISDDESENGEFPEIEPEITRGEIEIEELDLEVEIPPKKSLDQFLGDELEVELDETSELPEASVIETEEEEEEINHQPELLRTFHKVETHEKDIGSELKELGCYKIPKTIEAMNNFSNNLEYLGCRLIRVSSNLQTIFLFPIKTYSLDGTVLVDEAKLDHHESSDSNDKLRHITLNLLAARDKIFNDILNGDNFREFFQRYLQVDLTFDTTGKNKKLFFLSGSVQYKVLIEPILLTEKPPRCMEKSISFPYQRSTNLHVVARRDLSPLVRFLEEKYRLIETSTINSNTVKDYQNLEEKFKAQVRLTSISLVGYAIILGVVYFAELYFLLRLFNSIGFAALGIYICALAYLYFKFRKTKKEQAYQFETPYYLQDLEISEVDLLSFRDQFTDELMLQLGYECFGKDPEHKILEKVEKKAEKNRITIKRQEPELNAIYETEEESADDAKESTSERGSKYLSFLED